MMQMQQEFQRAIEALKGSKLSRGGANALYELPWQVIFIGDDNMVGQLSRGMRYTRYKRQNAEADLPPLPRFVAGQLAVSVRDVEERRGPSRSVEEVGLGRREPAHHSTLAGGRAALY